MAKTIAQRRSERKTEKTNKPRKAGKQSGHWIQPWRRLAIYIRDNFTCQYCGTNLKDAKAYEVTLDHLIERCNGGNHHESNLITCCTYCNSDRSNRETWSDYATGGAIERIKLQITLPLNIALAKSIIKDKQSKQVQKIEKKRG